MCLGSVIAMELIRFCSTRLRVLAERMVHNISPKEGLGHSFLAQALRYAPAMLWLHTNVFFLLLTLSTCQCAWLSSLASFHLMNSVFSSVQTPSDPT